MAIIVSTNSEAFLSKVLKPDVLPLYQDIKASGVTFETNLYVVSASKPGNPKGWQVQLPIAVFALVKDSNSPQAIMAINMINEFVCKLYAATVINTPPLIALTTPTAEVVDPVPTPPSFAVVLFGAEQVVSAIKIVREMTGLGLKEAKDLVDAANKIGASLIPGNYTESQAKKWETKFILVEAKAGYTEKTGTNVETLLAGGFAKFKANKLAETGVSPSTPAKPKAKAVSSEVVKLVDSEHVGQKVFGSSSGSVYVAIAVNPRVKVAARLVGTSLSLRVESKNPTAEEQKAINSVVQWKSNYGSQHFDIGNVPAKRVLGALIYGMGIQFDEVLKPGEIIGGH